MDISSATKTELGKDDRILTLTRIVAGTVIPFLLLAFVILFILPDQTGRWFAWDINPPMTAVFMGAGYIGGAYLFLHAVFGTRWHRVAAGFLPVTAFTLALLIVTIIHWERFDHAHLPFLVWLALYIVTPFLVFSTWYRNRSTDPGVPEENDPQVPSLARVILAGLGVVLTISAILTLVYPSLTMQFWPWELSALTARVLGSWFALLGAGGLVISLEERWSAWKTGMESIGLWHGLVLVGAVLHRQDFYNPNLINWYVISVVVMLLGMATLYVLMEYQRRKKP
jgi:hypothetical protein